MKSNKSNEVGLAGVSMLDSELIKRPYLWTFRALPRLPVRPRSVQGAALRAPLFSDSAEVLGFILNAKAHKVQGDKFSVKSGAKHFASILPPSTVYTARLSPSKLPKPGEMLAHAFMPTGACVPLLR